MDTIVGVSANDAANWLLNGEPVALPTETVYGLAAPAFNLSAVEKIFEYKGRPRSNPLIVHVENVEQMRSLSYTNDNALALAEAFWPGPLTLILPKKECISNVITAGHNSVAVRSPQNALFQQVLKIVGQPLVAPSANKFQEVSPTTANHVLKSLGGKIAYILDGGQCEFGLESTIVSLVDNATKILRPGPISAEEIEKIVGKTSFINETIENDSLYKIAPGLFKKHYSPKTPLVLVDKIDEQSTSNTNTAFVFLSNNHLTSKNNCFCLSKGGNLYEAAHNLFSMLQNLDNGNWNQIFIEKAPNVNIGIAINNRLTKASYQ